MLLLLLSLLLLSSLLLLYYHYNRLLLLLLLLLLLSLSYITSLHNHVNSIYKISYLKNLEKPSIDSEKQIQVN